MRNSVELIKRNYRIIKRRCVRRFFRYEIRVERWISERQDLYRERMGRTYNG
jgi:hypothetical protein